MCTACARLRHLPDRSFCHVLTNDPTFIPPPSIDRLLREPAIAALVAEDGREATLGVVRAVVAQLRRDRVSADTDEIARRCAALLATERRSSQRRVFNLTGTVLHTNL